MSKSIKTGIAAFLISFSFETIGFFLGLHNISNASFITFGTHSLILLIAISLVIVKWKKDKVEKTGIISQLKLGFTTSASFAILISCYLYSYHKWINPEYLTQKRQQLIEMTINDDQMIAIAKNKISSNPDFYDGKSADDLIEMQQENITSTLQPNKVLPISLFSFMFLGMIFTLLVSLINTLTQKKFNL